MPVFNDLYLKVDCVFSMPLISPVTYILEASEKQRFNYDSQWLRKSMCI